MRPRIPRNFFFYWSGQDFLFVHLLTIRSLLRTNPMARCEVHCRVEPVDNPHWETLKGLTGLRIVRVDFPELCRRVGVEIGDIDVCTNANILENHRSDIFRYLILACHGGIYVDFDTVILKDLNPLLETEFFIGYQQYAGKVVLNGGIMGAVADSAALRLCLSEMRSRLKHTDRLSWIALGPELLSEAFIRHRVGAGPALKILGLAAERRWPSWISRGLTHWVKRPGLTYELYPAHYFYPFPWYRAKEIFQERTDGPEAYALHYWSSVNHEIIRDIDQLYLQDSPSLFARILSKQRNGFARLETGTTCRQGSDRNIMKKIAIDIRPLQQFDNRFRGVGCYIYNLVREVIQFNNRYAITLLLSDQPEIPQVGAWLSGLRKVADRPLTFGKIPPPDPNPLAWRSQWGLYRYIKQHRIDLYHCPFQTGLPLFKPFRTVLTIHDLIPIRMRDHYFSGRGLRHRMRFYLQLFSGKRADRIVADSEHTQKDIMEILKVPARRIRVVYCGVNERFGPIPLRESDGWLDKRYGIRKPYLLYVGGIEFRKNLLRLLKAFQLIRRKQDISLVLVGKVDREGSQILASARDEGLLTEDVILTGFIPEDDLAVLYNRCQFFVFPSLYEGFGLPALEAMACGRTLIFADCSSLSEIVGDAGIGVNPYDVMQIVEGMEKLLSDNRLRAQLQDKARERAGHFSWRRAAIAMLDVYAEVLGDRPYAEGNNGYARIPSIFREKVSTSA